MKVQTPLEVIFRFLSDCSDPPEKRELIELVRSVPFDDLREWASEIDPDYKTPIWAERNDD